MKSNIENIASHNFQHVTQQIKERKKKKEGKKREEEQTNKIKSTHDSPIGLVTFKS